METKKCNTCGEEKTIDQFFPSKSESPEILYSAILYLKKTSHPSAHKTETRLEQTNSKKTR